MSLSKLNHDCFLAVLRACPLTKQQLLRQVSISWCTAIESQLPHRRSLALVQAKHCYFLYKFKSMSEKDPFYMTDHLRLKASTAHLAALLLIRLFPSIRKLLFFNEKSVVTQMHAYFRALSGSLSSLATIYPWKLDWTLLATIPTLKHLYCHFHILYYPDSPEHDIIKVLARLETFSTKVGTFEVLPHLGASIRYLKLDSFYNDFDFDYANLRESLPKLPEQVRSSLEHLSLAKIINLANFDLTKVEPVSVLKLFFVTFPNLKAFSLFDKKIPFEVLVSSVSRLRNLRKLTILKDTFQKAIDEGFDISKCTQLASVKIVCVD